MLIYRIHVYVYVPKYINKYVYFVRFVARSPYMYVGIDEYIGLFESNFFYNFRAWKLWLWRHGRSTAL